ncbi:uncharacterized protein [Drosophila virilis]|uniref:Cuticle protein 6 n=1 Tax=Drosophila virilis TaxID=7244 RepID=B4LDJ2_DROVI|nr:uncharacterized protein LOC6623122 [Drosophila virilis]EDW68930.2 uncharacterized protein Dvir_GJ12962 [Drosophila virilis]
MEVLTNTIRLWLFLLLLLLVAKVYAALATPVSAGNAAYAKTADENRSEPSKMSNYFLHEPYGPKTYAFGYEVEDAQSGNIQFRDERRFLNGSIEGSYGYVRPDGYVQVTRYRSNEESGYLAHSQSYAPGDQRVDFIWPTQRPDLLKVQHEMQPAVNISWDPKSHLNVSVDQVEHKVAQQLKQQHGLDLNHINVAQDVLQPAVLDIVNGKTPLTTQANGSLAFETLHNFIDNDLPLVPFELPAEELLTTTTTTTLATTLAPLGKRTTLGTYNKAKSNNDEKAPQVATVVISTTLPPPRPLVNDNSNASSWYHKIIQANRREFLEHLPNLHQLNA